MSESFGFIESGVVLNVKEGDLSQYNLSVEQFVVHGEAYSFLLEYHDEYGGFPPNQLLKEKFPELDEGATNSSFGYFAKVLQNQSLTRKASDLIRSQNTQMIENPKQAISNILFGLDNLSLSHDENISVYDTGSTARLQHYKERREIRQNSKLKLMGIPTPIRSINKAGFGIMPGEICSLFARTGVGKSWFCIKAAALCTHLGYKTLFFSPEMPAQQMDLRLDVVLAQIKGYQFSHYDLRVGNPIDEEQYEEFLKKANEKALLVCDHVDKSAIDLAGIAAMVRKHRPEVLIIDNMELLLGSIQGEAVWERMHSLYSGIKTLCTAFKVSAFVTHQAKQKGDVFRPPGLSEVAFGEALIRASDTAMSMSLVQDDDKKRMISFQKFRDVANKMPEYIYIDFDVDCGLFKESDA